MKKMFITALLCGVIISISSCGNVEVTDSSKAESSSTTTTTATTEVTSAETSSISTTTSGTTTTETTTTTKKSTTTSKATTKATKKKTTTTKAVTEAATTTTTFTQATQVTNPPPAQTQQQTQAQTQAQTTTTTAKKTQATTTTKATTKATTTKKSSKTVSIDTAKGLDDTLRAYLRLGRGDKVSKSDWELIRKDACDYIVKTYNGKSHFEIEDGYGGVYVADFVEPLRLKVNTSWTDYSHAHLNVGSGINVNALYYYSIRDAKNDKELYNIAIQIRDEIRSFGIDAICSWHWMCDNYGGFDNPKIAPLCSDLEFNIGIEETGWIWFLTE